MLSVNFLLAVCLGYVALLFAVAFIVDRRNRRGPIGWLQSPVIYTLSISVYCTSWTFYGAVGSAARSGLEFVTIYTGPTLVFIGWWWLLRKLVRIGRVHRVTSIADLISSRYGKSPSLAVLVTLIALIATTPYIALQLQSVTRSYQIIAGEADVVSTAFWVAAGMALFTVLFGTRNLDANERHHGVVAAIALEAIVKLVALIAVGVFATFGLSGGFDDVFANVSMEDIRGAGDIFGPRWATLTFLSAAAVICLPRQFQVTVVENIEERHLATASWLFPLYLFGMTLFIMPIAIVGLKMMPEGSNPDFFVLTLPLASQRDDLALLAFLGGFSSATSMVIVAAIAVSTMVSNHIVMPMAMRLLASNPAVSGDVRNLLLISRRISIALILGLGFLYFWVSGGSSALAAIGLIAFVGVAQFLPSLIGGIFWRGATRIGAIAGLNVGFLLWAYTLFLPSFAGDFAGTAAFLAEGPWGIALLRPQALFGLTGIDPLVHAVIWSVGLNTLTFLVVSSLVAPGALERLQGALFVDVYRTTGGRPAGVQVGTAQSEDLFILAQRILGAEPARRLFDEMSRSQGRAGGLPHPTDDVIGRLERELAGSIGAASAHAMVTRIAGRQTVEITDLFDIADETQRLIETSRRLSEKSIEQERTAQQLRNVNERLRALDAHKDDFLSQVSHELRTPMTSVRSFSEILMTEKSLSEDERDRFVSIIHDESRRLTRLLDELLDISRLEAGASVVDVEPIDARQAIDAALAAVDSMTRNSEVDVTVDPDPTGVSIMANSDRLRQVLINVLSNAVKYNAAEEPSIHVRTNVRGPVVHIDIIDNGGGVSRQDATVVFEKFARGSRASRDQGAGLGLPISRAIMRAMKGDLVIVFANDDTSYFRIILPLESRTGKATE
ncbi:sensor histidine kinase [Rhodobium gokarnense]|uniref:histidine kinase n=1 Tax=Rhodobium gokarnense TaxID=364296 RepID=A0ABT3H6V1_9HYPH|nr:sensor histidine kinase [Rhodobium gokarnense]MCW2306122.1 Na+/proline symporter/signal transduction histidine kinase [Rhodobium gokarnense]